MRLSMNDAEVDVADAVDCCRDGLGNEEAAEFGLVISPGDRVSMLGDVPDALRDTNKFDMVDRQPVFAATLKGA
jgi:hypothetical protein